MKVETVRYRATGRVTAVGMTADFWTGSGNYQTQIESRTKNEKERGSLSERAAAERKGWKVMDRKASILCSRLTGQSPGERKPCVPSGELDGSDSWDLAL